MSCASHTAAAAAAAAAAVAVAVAAAPAWWMQCGIHDEGEKTCAYSCSTHAQPRRRQHIAQRQHRWRWTVARGNASAECGVPTCSVPVLRDTLQPQSVGVVTNNTVHGSSGCAQSCSRAFTDVPRRSARSGIVFVYHRWHICVNPSSYHHSHIFPEENALRLKFAPGKQRCPTLNAVVSCSCPFTTPLAQQTSSLRIPYALCLRVPAVRCAAGACGRALSCVPCTVRTNTPSAVHPVRCLLSGL